MGDNYISEIATELRRELPDFDVPQGDSLLLLYALLVLARGESTSRADVHNAWVTWQTLNGEAHDASVPFGELSPESQVKDAPYVNAIRAVALRRRA